MSERRVALVTGAGQGIGRGIVLELARQGHDVVGLDVVFDPENHEKGLFEVKDRVEELGRWFVPVQGDVSDVDSHEALLNRILDEVGHLDVLVNNAGVAPKVRLDILETTPESYDRVMAINTRGAFFLTQKVARHMVQRAESNPKLRQYIVFITSVSAYVSSPSRAEYCASKAALSMIARTYADRLASHRINVYEIRPGIIRTDMTAVVKEKYDRLISEGLVPQRRWGFPEDVGKAVAGLVSGQFDYSTGAILEVSGGMNIPRL